MSDASTKKRRSVFGVYASHTLQHPWLFSTTVVCSFIMQATSLIAPLYLKKFINILASTTPSDFAIKSLMAILATIVVVWVVEWITERAQYIATMYLELGVMRDLYRSSF